MNFLLPAHSPHPLMFWVILGIGVLISAILIVLGYKLDMRKLEARHRGEKSRIRFDPKLLAIPAFIAIPAAYIVAFTCVLYPESNEMKAAFMEELQGVTGYPVITQTGEGPIYLCYTSEAGGTTEFTGKDDSGESVKFVVERHAESGGTCEYEVVVSS